MVVGFKHDGNIKILNGNERSKEGTSRGDTTTNLHNCSLRIFLVPTENLENGLLGASDRRKHNKYESRKPCQLFWKCRRTWTSIETGPIFDFSGWESRILNLQGATNPMGPTQVPPIGEFSAGIWGLGGFAIDGKWLSASNGSVSYTHLTLPTIYSV